VDGYDDLKVPALSVQRFPNCGKKHCRRKRARYVGSTRTLVRGGREVFGLKVTGDSMIDAGIFRRDYIFVKKQLTASGRHRGGF